MWIALISSLEPSLEPSLLVQLLAQPLTRLLAPVLEQQLSLEQPSALLSISSQLLLASEYGCHLARHNHSIKRGRHKGDTDNRNRRKGVGIAIVIIVIHDGVGRHDSCLWELGGNRVVEILYQEREEMSVENADLAELVRFFIVPEAASRKRLCGEVVVVRSLTRPLFVCSYARVFVLTWCFFPGILELA